MSKIATIHAAVFDVDGVIWMSGGPAKGAHELLAGLTKLDFPFCFLTNSCSTSKATRYATLRNAGLAFSPQQLLTSAEVTNEWLIASGADSIMYLGAPDALTDLNGPFNIKHDGSVDAVVVGDLFDHYNRASIEKAAIAIEHGAQLVAMHRSARWSDGRNSFVDNGFWIAGFEYVTGHAAVVTGKPNRFAYMEALKRLNEPIERCGDVALVSDDIDGDLKGGKAVGFVTVYCGPPRCLPDWVDFCAHDMVSLASVLTVDTAGVTRCAKLP